MFPLPFYVVHRSYTMLLMASNTMPLLAQSRLEGVSPYVWIIAIVAVLSLLAIPELLGLRYIPNNSVGVVEKLWSGKGSVTEGRILALNDEAGFQADLLRGGFHLGYWRWQYRIHKVSLVTVPQGKIGYI